MVETRVKEPKQACDYKDHPSASYSDCTMGASMVGFVDDAEVVGNTEKKELKKKKKDKNAYVNNYFGHRNLKY